MEIMALTCMIIGFIITQLMDAISNIAKLCENTHFENARQTFILH